jgi:hypothetical protein
MDYFTSENVGAILDLLVKVVGVASLIATMTPNEADNKVVNFVLNLINMFGANVGKAKNDPSV